MRKSCLSIALLTTIGSASAQVFPTPRWIERCEKAIAEMHLRPGDKPYLEHEARVAAATLYSCDERRLLDRTDKNALLEGPLAPYFEAFAKDPNVWRRK